MAKEQYNQNLIRNAKLVPMTNNLDDFGITNNGAIAIDGDQIVWSGKEKDIPEKYKKYNEFNAKGKCLVKDGVHINSEKIKYMYKISLSKIISRL